MKIGAKKVRLHYDFNEQDGACYSEFTPISWLRRYVDGDSAGFVTKERAGDMPAYVTSTYCVQDR